MTLGFQMHVSIPYFSGIPEDVVTNVWSFQYVTLSPSNADWVALRGALVAFYNSVYSASALKSAPWCLPANTLWKGYDLSDPIPRAPRFQSVTPITVSVVTPCTVQPETAVCLSFQGDLVSGAPQARRRGRVFLGGIGEWTAGGTASGFPPVTAGKISTITGAASALKTAVSALGWTWSVYSRTNNVLVPVTNGWVDNAPDTQRRRGAASTLRTTWT